MAPTLDQVLLAEKTLEWILDHPELHDQSDWLDLSASDVGFHYDVERAVSCGTAACFAGWAAMLNGAQLQYDPDAQRGAVIVTADGQPVDEYAAHILGVPAFRPYIVNAMGQHDDHIFDSENTLEDIEEHVRLMRQAYEQAQVVGV